MLSLNQAINVVQQNHPNGTIHSSTSYKNLYLFIVLGEDPFEGNMDTVFSVNKDTGEFKDFSIFEDGNTAEILSLFRKEVLDGRS